MKYRGYFSENKETADEIFIREKLLGEVLDCMLLNERVIGIRGFRRTGKTTFLKYIVSLLHENGVSVAFVDVQNILSDSSVNYFIKNLDKVIMEHTNKKEYLIRRAVEGLAALKGDRLSQLADELFDEISTTKKKNDFIVYVFDEVQSIIDFGNRDYTTRFINYINRLLKKNENSFVLFSGSHVRTFNVFMDTFVGNTVPGKFKASNKIVDVGLMSRDEVRRFLEKGLFDNGLTFPWEDYAGFVYDHLGGFIGYVANAGRKTVNLMSLDKSTDDIKNAIKTEQDALFGDLKNELKLLDKSLGFEVKGPRKTPSMYILHHISANNGCTTRDIISAVLERFSNIDEEYVKIVLDTLEQAGLIKRRSKKLITHNFVRNYKGW